MHILLDLEIYTRSYAQQQAVGARGPQPMPQALP